MCPDSELVKGSALLSLKRERENKILIKRKLSKKEKEKTARPKNPTIKTKVATQNNHATNAGSKTTCRLSSRKGGKFRTRSPPACYIPADLCTLWTSILI